MYTITNDGYTLVEVLVALAILGVVAVPLAMFLANITSQVSNNIGLDAATLANNCMEETIAKQDYYDKTTTEVYNKRKYLVEFKWNREGLIGDLTIIVRAKDQTKVIYTLFRRFYVST